MVMQAMACIGFGTERPLEATQPWDLRLLKTQTVGVKPWKPLNVATASRKSTRPPGDSPSSLLNSLDTAEEPQSSCTSLQLKRIIKTVSVVSEPIDISKICRAYTQRIFLQIADRQMRRMCFASRW